MSELQSVKRGRKIQFEHFSDWPKIGRDWRKMIKRRRKKGEVENLEKKEKSCLFIKTNKGALTVGNKING